MITASQLRCGFQALGRFLLPVFVFYGVMLEAFIHSKSDLNLCSGLRLRGAQ